MLPLDYALVFLAGCAVGWLAMRRRVPTPDRSARQSDASVACSVCNRPFPDRSAAREHCRDVHNAPDAVAADHLLTDATAGAAR